MPAPTANVLPNVVWPIAFAVPGQHAVFMPMGFIDSSGIAALQKSHRLVLPGKELLKKVSFLTGMILCFENGSSFSS